MAQNTPRGTPARVLILFALLTGVTVVSALRDSRRPGLASVSYPTAVGDTDFHRPGDRPLQIAVHGSIFSLHEEADERLHRRDDRMFRVPLAVSVPRVYTTAESFSGEELPPLYLKAGHGEYVRVGLQKGIGADDEAGMVKPEGAVAEQRPPEPDSE